MSDLLNKMNIEIKWHEDMWQEIKDNALFTIHKENGRYPTSEWKQQILLAEHSPIRTGRLIINVYNIPSFVIGHFVRHHEGFVPFVSSLRSDRCNYDKIPDRNTLNNMRFDGNFQAFINISRKRYCNCASKETRKVWQAIMEEVKKFESELYYVCVPECIYRGGCPEMFKCKEHFYGKFLNSVENKMQLFDVDKRYELYHKFIEEGD